MRDLSGVVKDKDEAAVGGKVEDVSTSKRTVGEVEMKVETGKGDDVGLEDGIEASWRERRRSREVLVDESGSECEAEVEGIGGESVE